MMDAVELAKQLIEVETTAPVTDREVFELLQEVLASHGIESEIVDCEGVKNIVADCHGSGTSICFNGHLDVVEAGTGWEVTDPFEPVVEDGWLYGRGAADMKASFAAQVMAFIELCEDDDFDGHMTLMGVGDEEIGGFKGTQKLIEKYNGYDYAVIGEPTDMDLQVGVRGVKWIYLYFKGESGHASRPEDSYNVNEDLPRILEALNSMEMSYEPDEMLPEPTAPVTQVEASGPHNSFPGEVLVGLDVRPLPSQSMESIKQDIRDALADIDVAYEMQVTDHGQAFKLEDERFKRVAEEAVRAVTGETPDQVTDGGSSDGRFFAEHGTPFMEIGVSGATSHQTDERCRVENVRQLQEIYTGLARRLASGD